MYESDAGRAVESSPSRGSDLLRSWVVLISAVVAVVGSAIGSGAFGGTPVSEASGGALAADATPVAPAGSAFSIWSVIYAGLIGFALWQALPGQRADRRQRRVGWPVAASMVLNAAWILSIQVGALAASVPVIVVLLLTLLAAFLGLVQTRPRSAVETVVVDGTIGVYLGWVCLATVANLGAVLVDSGANGFGLDGQVWAGAGLAAAALVGVALAVRGRGRFGPAAALAWGLGWIAAARIGGEPASVPVAATALVCAGVVLVVTVFLRLRAHPAHA